MNDSAPEPEAEIDRLLAEIQRYLAFIDVLRLEGLEPTWAREDLPRCEGRYVSSA